MSETCEGFNVRKIASASSKPLYRLYVQGAESFGLSPFWKLHRTLLARVMAPGGLLGMARRVTTLASTGRPGHLLGTLISQAPKLPGSSQAGLLFRLFFDGFSRRSLCLGHTRAPEAATSAMLGIFFSLFSFFRPRPFFLPVWNDSPCFHCSLSTVAGQALQSRTAGRKRLRVVQLFIERERRQRTKRKSQVYDRLPLGSAHRGTNAGSTKPGVLEIPFDIQLKVAFPHGIYAAEQSCKQADRRKTTGGQARLQGSSPNPSHNHPPPDNNPFTRGRINLHSRGPARTMGNVRTDFRKLVSTEQLHIPRPSTNRRSPISRQDHSCSHQRPGSICHLQPLSLLRQRYKPRQ